MMWTRGGMERQPASFGHFTGSFFIFGLFSYLVVCFAQDSSSCTDEYPNSVCKSYKARKLCVYVKKWCELTCEVCKPKVCKDQSTACPYYAREGFCIVSEFYKNYCGKSCNSCPGQTPVVGVWERWSEFGRCSVTCGQGTQVRMRKCRGGNCFGPGSEERDCTTAPCPVAQWTGWGPFSPCSASCGYGYKTRTRSCSIANQCTGANRSTRSCVLAPTCIRRGQWVTWGPFSVCSVSCGKGTQSRYRTCSGGKNCQGLAISTRECTGLPCTSDYGWSNCTKPCGTGTRYKFDSEQCNNENNPGCLRTFEECNIGACPEEKCGIYETRRYKGHSCCKVSNERGCGRSFLTQRIIGGESASQYRWPWMVYLNVRGSLCGGTLITKRWIVTAGHCMKDGIQTVLPREITAHVGISSLSASSRLNRFSVSRVILHPRYKNLNYDIALVKLSKTVRLSAAVQPICLPQGETPPVDSTCFAIGWGLTIPNPQRLIASDPLMEVELKNLDVAACRKIYAKDRSVGAYVLNTDNLLCAGSLTKSIDVCKGDSGGPLLCQRCNSCSWYIAGVTSFGPKGTCGKRGYPGMYTKVSAFEEWIFRYIPFLRKNKNTCTGSSL